MCITYQNAAPNWDSIPKPEDDGGADHLQDAPLPSIALPSTSGSTTDISELAGLTIVFFYPRTAAPTENVPESWNSIPGARGCTPQACSFRDASRDLLSLGVSHIFGCSTQDTAHQAELKERTHLPYQLLSDEKLQLAEAMKLPTFEWQGQDGFGGGKLVLLKRLTLAVEDGKVVKVFYPVFPPDESANEVVKWLKDYAGRSSLSTKDEEKMMRNWQHR